MRVSTFHAYENVIHNLQTRQRGLQTVELEVEEFEAAVEIPEAQAEADSDV